MQHNNNRNSSANGVNWSALGVVGVFFVFQLIAWISCCVTFGSDLFSSSLVRTGLIAYYYWDHILVGNYFYSFQEFNSNFGEGLTCKGGGQGTLAMTVFAFLALSACMLFTILRILGKEQLLPFISSPAQCLKYEVILVVASAALFFLAIVIFGGACYSPISTSESVTATGYAFMIVAWFFLLFAVAMGVHMMKSLYPAGDHYQGGAIFHSEGAPTGPYEAYQDDQARVNDQGRMMKENVNNNNNKNEVKEEIHHHSSSNNNNQYHATGYQPQHDDV